MSSPAKTRSSVVAKSPKNGGKHKLNSTKSKSKKAKKTKVVVNEHENNYVDYDSEDMSLSGEDAGHNDSSQSSNAEVHPAADQSEVTLNLNQGVSALSPQDMQQNVLQQQKVMTEQFNQQMVNLFSQAQSDLTSMMHEFKKTTDQAALSVKVASERANLALTPQRMVAVGQAGTVVTVEQNLGGGGPEIVAAEPQASTSQVQGNLAIDSPSGGTVLSRVCKKAGTVDGNALTNEVIETQMACEIDNVNLSSDESYNMQDGVNDGVPCLADEDTVQFEQEVAQLNSRQMGIDGSQVKTPDQRRREQVAAEKASCGQRVNDTVRAAEAVKASILRPPPGKQSLPVVDGHAVHDICYDLNCDYESCLLISHVDEQTKFMIENTMFVEMSKCLPKERAFVRNEAKVQMLNKDGETYLIASKDRQHPAINGIKRWCDAFRIFIAVYVNKHPHRAMELLQYMDMIQDTATRFVWENVDRYDVLFREHMQKHPNRNWGTVYQMAYNFALKDKISHNSPKPNRPRKKLTCRRLNKTGKCKFGNNCRFDHRCDSCGEYGHGAATCRKGKQSTDKALPAPPAASTDL